MPPLTIEVSPAEVIDRLTILKIKADRLPGHPRVAAALLVAQEARHAIGDAPEVIRAEEGLAEVNERLWRAEDSIRALERSGYFGPEFVAVSRAIRRDNDERARLKKELDEALGAGELAEVKQHNGG